MLRIRVVRTALFATVATVLLACLAVAFVLAVMLSGCKKKAGIPANYYDTIASGDALHWPSRTYTYCIDESSLDVGSGEHEAIESAVSTWVNLLNEEIAKAPAGLPVGEPFKAVEVPCVVPGDTPINGIAKWIGVESIQGHNNGYTAVLSAADHKTITASVSQILRGQKIGDKYNTTLYLQITAHEFGRSMGIFGDSIPKITAGQKNVMAKVADTALPSPADLTTLLLVYRTAQ